MIRLVLAAAVAATLVLPAYAAEWTRYIDPRSGAGVDIPPGYGVNGPAGEGDGKIYRAADGRSAISVWGAPAGGEFSTAMARRIGQDEAEGWGLTYRSVTPDWAAWSGTRAGHVFYAKTILVCDGRQTANVRLQYPAADIPKFDVIAMRLGQSLAQDGGCF
ncbi:hypothetical protein [Pelagibacterium limicola]|uniref:hypothetical protein n=1 Tax=Pelagibacterium limicola TaxID=2791022 RepID=UPI0018AF9F5C|nr:hypothetical protein [Pelagibacterium limicola]